ncbi:neurofibromin-like isoform X2 [Clavelina lepadiformis]|uniref:neurofibromin-like isoform X2 n=1 Tax=Clavelina lepadiformis TaxID=159417 RepID=UPI004042C9DC
MANHRPREWISAVLSRFDKLLAATVTQNASLSGQFEKHKECLITTSQTDCATIISGLTNSLKKLFSIRIYGERQEHRLYAAQIIVLDLLEKCITTKDSTLQDDSNLMKQLLPEICQLLHQPLNDKPVLTQLQASASRVLYCISQNNFNVVFSRISTRIHDLNMDDLADLSDLDLLQHIYIDLSRITKLLEDIVHRFRNLRKSVQNVLLSSLEKTLWNWLSSYPAELSILFNTETVSTISSQEQQETSNQLLQTMSQEDQQNKIMQLSSAAEKLFDLLDMFTDGSKKKAASCWPLQTTLLIFCPDILRQVADGTENAKSSKHELFIQLRKTVVGRHIHENCSDSYIRLLKAASCIKPRNNNPHSLHKLVNGFLPDLQTYLFENGLKYFSKTCDQKPLIECFVSSFRLYPNKDNLARLCASSNSSVHLKMVFVQALHCISTQPCLDWWPHIDQLYVYGSDIRKIFHDCVTKVQGHPYSSPRSSQSLLREKMERMNVGLKRTQDEQPNNKDLLQVIIQLIQGHPSILLKNLGTTNAQIHSEVTQFFKLLVSLFTVQSNASIQLSFESLNALLSLHNPQVIPLWNPESLMHTFTQVSSSMLEFVCEKLLMNQMTTSPEISSHALKWIQEILACRVDFFIQNPDKMNYSQKSEAVKKAQVKLEVTLLGHLWNSDTDVVLLALSCFQFLHEEFELRCTRDDYFGTRSHHENCELYQNLAMAAMTLSGNKTIQEKVTSILLHVQKFSPACLETWEDLREKWEKRISLWLSLKQNREDAACSSSAGESPTALKQGSRKSIITKQDVLDWVNMTRFLCALGGVCIKITETQIATGTNNLAGDRRISTSSALSSSATSTPVGGASDHIFPDKNFNGKNTVSVTHVNKFINNLLTLLGNCNTRKQDINDAIRDLLGVSLHPALYPTLFQQINLLLKSTLFSSSGHIQLNMNNDLFIQYIISVLKSIFEHCSEMDADYLSEESIESTVLLIVRYVRHTSGSNPNFAVQLRIKFCKMVAEMMNRKNDLFFLSEIQFRNKLVEHLTDWMMTSSQTVSLHKSDFRDLDESATVAVGMLLNGLPLHPDEGDGGDVPHAKSQLFLKYFTLFMKLLGECRDEFTDSDIIEDDILNTHQTIALRDALILAMSNLLSANIEYGLVHAMSLAYHNDVQTRAAFLEVLIKILQQGTCGFNSLGDSVLAERFERLVELVTMMGDNGELPIANGLASVVHTTYADELARVFVTLFDAKHLLYQLLWNMFTKEVEEADSVQTLFRGNSLASKIMTFCFKVYGASYLHNLMEPLMAWSLTPEVASLQYDVDQKRIPPGVDIMQCRANLQKLTERFFSRIMTSTDKFPPQLKSVCHCLYQVVSQRFHDSGTGAVASAVFLRFLNPAIATPYDCGLCDKRPPPNLAKAFKFMCKIMQNIANHVLFTKEEHMKHFNDFVRARFDICQQFFMQISTPECSSSENIVHNTSYMNDTNVAALHRLLWNDQEKIGKFLAKSRNAKAVGRRPFDKMVTLLAYLGPPEYTRPVLETRITGQNITPCKFEELMTKRKAADSEEYKMVKGLNIFYQFGRSKMGYPVFYYIARRYVAANIREDILMFYILQALKPYSARKFDIIVDLTHVSQKNSLRLLSNWLVVYPQTIYKNLDNTYIYNPNTWFREYVKYNESTFNLIKEHKGIQFIEELSELQKFIELDRQKIPSATRGLDEDLTVYCNAFRSGNTKVHIKVGSKAVQITMVERTKVLGYDVILNDIYYSNEIELIHPSEESASFGFTISVGNSVLLFTHPEASKILEDIRHIRARWELTQPQPEISTHHKISAKDVPGTLLNMALLNFGCSHPMVRLSAYNLLCCLTKSFYLQLEGRLCESEGLCIPANNTLFIVSISNTLAKNESHLTLEFLKECIAGFCSSSDKLKNLCLEYMEPWLFNLPAFSNADETKRSKVKAIIGQLIELTIAEKNFYPSVQTKIWGNLGKMSGLIDMILESFIETSSQGGLGSVKAEVMADTSVALAANNMKLVSSKIINRLCHIVDKTSLRPTPTLEKHKNWDEIAILARYLLMLSFNNNLDVATHLPYLFHLVSLLLSTGPASLRASIHGLVINIIHSLLTCRQLEFQDDTQRILRLSLTGFDLPKFYQFFGIPNVKSAADTAFKPESFVQGRPSVSDMPPQDSSTVAATSSSVADDLVNLSFLDEVVDALLEVMEACAKHMPAADWLYDWQELTQKFAFQYNPSLQPRALVVMGCISKRVSKRQIKQIFEIMGRSLECNADPVLFEATIICLTRLQHILSANHEFHCIFFWIGICAMQLNEEKLYSSGVALVEQNLHHLHEMGAFILQAPSAVLMHCRASVEACFQQLDVAVNIDFKSNFHYAFVIHLIKGFRHSDSVVVARVIRVLEFSLELVARYRSCHKYEVNPDSVPYLAALLPVSVEVKRHCVSRKKSESSSIASHNSSSSSKVSNGPRPAGITSGQIGLGQVDDLETNSDSGSHSSRSLQNCIPEDQVAPFVTHRTANVSCESRRSLDKKATMKLSKRPDKDCGTTPPKLRKVGEGSLDSDSSTSSGSHATSSSVRSSRRKHSIDPTNNVLLDDEILDQKSQALLLSLLASQVKQTPTNADVHVVYEYIAQASVAFPAVFPIVYSLIDNKINNVLLHCEDTLILSHVQLVVHNALLYKEPDQTHRHRSYLQSIGFGGMWRFTSPFAKVASLENASIIVKSIDAFMTIFMADIPGLTPVSSRQSLNSALSATSADGIHDTESGESDTSAMDDDGHVVRKVGTSHSQPSVQSAQPLGSAPKSGSFRNKGPKLTIKLPT